MTHTNFSKVRGALVGLGVACAAQVFGGCATTAREADHGVSAIQFADIPVPAGMELKTYSHESHSYEVDGFRYGDFEYIGGVNAGVVSQYMVDRMAIHGWKLTGDEGVQGGRELRFWRPPYRATCRIYKQDYRTRMNVEVRTVLDGEATGSAAD